MQTSFDRTGGSSGSPVYNRRNKVIGIHYKGTNTSSFELPIDYIKEKLPFIQKKKQVKSGFIGAQLDFMKLAQAMNHLNFPKRVAKRIRKLKKDFKYIIYVSKRIRGFPANQVLEPRDIIYSI
jgi:S1-C subfamily serine protease